MHACMHVYIRVYIVHMCTHNRQVAVTEPLHTHTSTVPGPWDQLLPSSRPLWEVPSLPPLTQQRRTELREGEGSHAAAQPC